MKKFFKNNGLITLLWFTLAVIFGVGGVYSNYMVEQRPEDVGNDEERYYNAVDLLSLEYNFDLDTIGENVFVATFTYEGNTYKTYVDHTFCYNEMIEGEELDLMVMAAVKHHAEQEAILSNTAYISGYDSTTRTVTLTTTGFAGAINVSVTLNDTFDAVESYLVTSNENYDNDYNSGYSGGAAPVVENTMMDDYLDDYDVNVDTIAGASVGTGEGMIELINVLNLFIQSLSGGN
jgi:hypothetical protein